MTTLAAYLADTGTSQNDFAVTLGVDKGTVSRLVAGKMTPSLPLAAKIEAVTGRRVLAVSLVHRPSPVNTPPADQGRDAAALSKRAGGSA